MSQIDLQPLLREWHHDPDQVSVRKVICTDGAVRLQMRIELGVLQMETSGRPDGDQPFGFTTLLEFHKDQLERHERLNGTNLGFTLTPDECRQLRIEASQFYRRYVAYFVLDEYANVLRDTTHSLEIFEFCRQYAFEREDRDCVLSFIPSVVMMATRARAYQAQQRDQLPSAVAHVNRGMMELRAHFELIGRPDVCNQSEEFRVLQALGHELTKQLPTSSLLYTQKALRAAVREGRFEDAARLRDSLKSRNDLACKKLETRKLED